MNAIEVIALRKEFRSRRRTIVAVDGLDLTVPAGTVFGFLGPNGAGKSTTIRCILGLVRPSAGRIRVLGREVQDELSTISSYVGSLPETPSFDPRLPAARNLEILAALGGVDAAAIPGVLERVGLADRAGDGVGRFSLGMKQRLGIAAALLKNPPLLIFDEPMNGLDPAGVVEIRTLIRRLADEGRTVFLSSHILGEVQQIADQVAILARGRCLRSGPIRDVLASAGRHVLEIEIRDPEAGIRALRVAGWDAQADHGLLRVDASRADAERVSSTLFGAGLVPISLRSLEPALEDVFLSLTEEGGDDREARSTQG